MAKSTLYTSNSDIQLSLDILHQAGKMNVSVMHYIGKGTMGTPGATATVTLTNPQFQGVALADDDYNTSTLFIRDDNSVLSSVPIDDSAGVAKTVTVDTTATLLISDGVSAGAFTVSAIYDVYILEAQKFIGFSTQEFNYEQDVEIFKNDDNEAVEEDILEARISVSGEMRTFGIPALERIMTLTQNGLQTGQEEYHGGFLPVRENFALIIDGMTDTEGKVWDFTVFKGRFRPNGAIATSPKGYKTQPYIFTGLNDLIRDNSTVNAFKIRRVG